MKRILFAMTTALCALGMNAQQQLREVRGRVFDAATGKPAAGVRVKAYNSASAFLCSE